MWNPNWPVHATETLGGTDLWRSLRPRADRAPPAGAVADEEKAAVRRLNKTALNHVVYVPLGFFLRYAAWRKNVSGIVQAPVPLFWGVSKTV